MFKDYEYMTETEEYKALSEFINSMNFPEEEYITLYNLFAEFEDCEKLEDRKDIYTEKNNQKEFIIFLLLFAPEEVDELFYKKYENLFPECMINYLNWW